MRLLRIHDFSYAARLTVIDTSRRFSAVIVPIEKIRVCTTADRQHLVNRAARPEDLVNA